MMWHGHLWGGPDHGNLVSTTVDRFRCIRTITMHLDGGYKTPSVTEIDGVYIWNPEKSRFDWEGPGASGDTIERLRLQ